MKFEIVPIIIIVISIINAIVKSKKKREQAERRRQEASHRMAENPWQSAQPSVQPPVYYGESVPDSAPQRTQQPMQSRNVAPIGTQMQSRNAAPIGTQMQSRMQAPVQSRNTTFSSISDSEGRSEWSRDMQSGFAQRSQGRQRRLKQRMEPRHAVRFRGDAARHR